MNQILSNKKNEPNFNKKFSFLFLIFGLLIILISSITIFFHFSRTDNYSNKLINNYNISQLYNNISTPLLNTSKNFTLLGMIEIPSLKITYPIISECNDSNLKISPCKFSGPNIGDIGNLCIVGHNYDNSLFFSNIHLLKENDTIILYDLSGFSYTYFVTSSFEVFENDFSIINNSNFFELTLITCNNFNSNRFIVKAKKT